MFTICLLAMGHLLFFRYIVTDHQFNQFINYPYFHDSQSNPPPFFITLREGFVTCGGRLADMLVMLSIAFGL